MYSITEEVIKWLSNLGYSASTYPPDGSTEFVTVERTGGGVADLVDHPTIAIQTWAQSEPRAEEMANGIRLAALTAEPPYGVASMRVNSGPYPFWDEDTGLPRYQTVFDCTAIISKPENE